MKESRVGGRLFHQFSVFARNSRKTSAVGQSYTLIVSWMNTSVNMVLMIGSLRHVSRRPNGSLKSAFTGTGMNLGSQGNQSGCFDCERTFFMNWITASYRLIKAWCFSILFTPLISVSISRFAVNQHLYKRNFGSVRSHLVRSESRKHTTFCVLW